jgi:hypothetical protein
MTFGTLFTDNTKKTKHFGCPNAKLLDVNGDLRFRKIFNLGITKDIFEKKLSKLEKLQSLVAKCCKIRKI